MEELSLAVLCVGLYAAIVFGKKEDVIAMGISFFAGIGVFVVVLLKLL